MNKDITRRQLPPRPISWFTQAVVLSGGFFTQFGWAFFGFGMIFVWAFVLNSTVVDWFSTDKRTETTTGIITNIKETNSSENDVYIYRNDVEFTAGSGTVTAPSYTRGRQFSVGQEVLLKYSVNQPERAVIEGARSQPFSPFVLFVGIFPLVGFVFLYIGIRRNLKALDLLKNGHFTKGTMHSKTDTGGSIRINERTYPIYKYEFEYHLMGRRYVATCQTHKTELVEDEKEEIILYHRTNYEYSVVYDAIGNAPHFDENGLMKSMPASKMVYLIAPVLTLVIHGIVALVYLF